MQHLIFEGPELAGKSWIMSQIYEYLEKKNNTSKNILNGCHWFNCDNGVFGTEYGKKTIEGYLEIFKTLKEKNIIVEKLFLADKIYNRLHNNIEINYTETEDALNKLDFKSILITFPNDIEIIKERIQDRLNIYPHYKRILQKPEWYLKQREEYLKEIKKSKLPYLIIETNKLPDDKIISDILFYINESN